MAETYGVAGHYCLEITEESAVDKMEEDPLSHQQAERQQVSWLLWMTSAWAGPA